MQVGQTVGRGRFRLDVLIGTGASGRVYRATQLSLGRSVAVKVLRPGLLSDPGQAERFREEALLAAQVNHPNVASVIDCSEPGDAVPFIAMELVSGKTLYQLLEKESPLELGRALDLFCQLLSGLEEIHEAGVVHADLKSPNIIISHTRTGVERPKLVDFGIAVSRERGRSRRDEGILCGTPEYLAPEVIVGECASVASDVYGAGIILFELLTGQPPFLGADLGETLQKHLDKPIPKLAPIHAPAVTTRLNGILRKALAKDPLRRFRSVAALRAAVIAAGSHSRGPSVMPVTIRPRKRRRAMGRGTEPQTVDVKHPVATLRG